MSLVRKRMRLKRWKILLKRQSVAINKRSGAQWWERIGYDGGSASQMGLAHTSSIGLDCCHVGALSSWIGPLEPGMAVKRGRRVNPIFVPVEKKRTASFVWPWLVVECSSWPRKRHNGRSPFLFLNRQKRSFRVQLDHLVPAGAFWMIFVRCSASSYGHCSTADR